MQYTGRKIVQAIPMNRAEYNTYRGWELPLDENGADEGMLVEYMNGGSSNHPNHEGYVSWSPKEVFESSYKKSETFLDRLLNEARELAEKLNSLNSFMATSSFVDLDRANKDLLYSQSRLMNEYLQVLGKRIELLDGKFVF